MRGVKERPFWSGLAQDVWAQHPFCASEREAVVKAIALVDSRVGDMLARRRGDADFGRVTGASLTVAVGEFLGDMYRLRSPDGVDQACYVDREWRFKGIWAAHDRLNRWADFATRFRDRPLTAAGGSEAIGSETSHMARDGRQT